MTTKVPNLDSHLKLRINGEMLQRIRYMAQEEGRTVASMVRALVRYGIEKVESQKETGR